MIYQEKFDINEKSLEYFSKEFSILITGQNEQNDNRHSHFKNSLLGFNGIVYLLDTCENAEKLDYRIETQDGILIEEAKNKLLIPNLCQLIKCRGFQGSSICIDITSLKQGILFLLIKLLIKEIMPAKLFAAYTEPKEYKRRTEFLVGETEEFDLYDRIIGNSKGVPGFYKHKSSKSILLLSPIGFDSQRLQTIYESLKPKKIIPIVGFPSFVPGWNITSIKANFLTIKSSDCCEWLKPCEASSPFALYELLHQEFHRYNSDYDIYISPLGTRPHCLGAAIFVSKNPSTYLVYDFPVEKKYRSCDVLKTNIYNLTKYIG